MPVVAPTDLPYSPSGIPRNYGIDFYIYSTSDRPMNVIAATTDFGLSSQYQYIPSPSYGFISYMDYILGAGTQSAPQLWSDCLAAAFIVDSYGGGGAHVFAGM